VRRNPITFDNRFAPAPLKRYPRSRAVASIVAAPRQRAQVERLAESPHTFRVIVLDEPLFGLGAAMDNAKPGSITLPISLKSVEEAEEDARVEGVPSGKVGLFSAFTFLHRVGDALFPVIYNVIEKGDVRGLVDGTWEDDIGGAYFLPESHSISKRTLALARKVAKAAAVPIDDSYLTYEYVATHTNSHISRSGFLERGWGDNPENFLDDDFSQCVADWVALSEMPSARARPGRGEPWLLFPPQDSTHPDAKLLRRYADIINKHFPPFIQSLLDDLEGAVFLI